MPSRACSISLGLQRTPSPLGVLVAQHQAQLAKHVAESAMSGVGQIADETRRVRGVAEAAIAEARSVHAEVESRVASLAAQADASTPHIIGVLSQCVQEVAEHSDA